MKTMMKMTLAVVMMCCGVATMNAQDNKNDANAVDTKYIQLDDNLEPINHVGLKLKELKKKIGDLETILITDDFQLYAAGDYTYKLQNGVVVSQTIQIADEKDTKVVYNQILNALAKSNSIKDTHNTGGNFYQYANFQVQFDDFQGYEKLTFQANPQDELTDNE